MYADSARFGALGSFLALPDERDEDAFSAFSAALRYRRKRKVVSKLFQILRHVVELGTVSTDEMQTAG